MSFPDGSNLVSIGERAFRNCDSITSVSLPDSLTSIERAVYAGCTSLHTLALPSNLETIGEFAFHGCESLDTVILPTNATFTIGRDAFGQTPVCDGTHSSTLCNYIESSTEAGDHSSIIETAQFAGGLAMTNMLVVDILVFSLLAGIALLSESM